MLVTKYSGEVVPFEEGKLYHSLKQVGAKENDIQKILKRVKEDMVDKKATSKIYREAFVMLKQLSKASAARFNLKRSILDLGPSGFPFEKFIGELYRHHDYKVQNNVIMTGKCVKHEIDVIAERNNTTLFIECKFHNRQGIKSDVKVAMYFKSRADDLRSGNQHRIEYKGKKIIGCLATNTRFSTDAIRYSKCEKIQLISWDYPKHGSLKDQIELAGLYPITCLTSLKKKEKLSLLNQGIVLAKDISLKPDILGQFSMSNYRYKNILNEIRELCNY